MSGDVFSGLADEPAADATATRLAMLGDARRGYVPLRKDFVQRPSGDRASVLAQMVTSRMKVGLDLLLTIHALQPLKDAQEPAVWARMIGATTRTTTQALRGLERLRLVELSGPAARPEVTLLRENGDGNPWSAPSAGRSDDGRGFLTLPHEYWTDGVIDRLGLPGKAMLLILLRETQDPHGRPWFAMAHARAKEWYGISERTAERGYRELRDTALVSERGYYVADPRHPRGRRYEIARALDDPFSTRHRDRLQNAAREAAGQRGDKKRPGHEGTEVDGGTD